MPRWGMEKQARYARLAARTAARGLEIPEALATAVLARDREGIALGIHRALADGIDLPDLVQGAYRGLTRAQPHEESAALAWLAEAAECLEVSPTCERLLESRRPVAAGGGL